MRIQGIGLRAFLSVLVGTGVGLLVLLWGAAARAGGPAGSLIGTVDYSDTFTFEAHGGLPGRANGVFGVLPPYAVEDAHGNPPSTWIPQTNFSFNDIPGSFGDGPVVLAAATGNPGAATGFAQSGGGDFSFAYGLRTNYIVEMDAFLSPGDRTDISSLPNPGDTIFAANSLSVFFRREGAGNGEVGIFNGAAETVLGPSGIANLDDNWHNLAVNFNQDDDRLVIYIDGAVFADLDLVTFAGGAYRNYSNGAVGAGGAGAFVRNLVNWFDNFRVGAPVKVLYCDDFDRPDESPVSGWTEFTNLWRIEGNRLVVGPTPTTGPGGEAWAWLGDPPVSTPANVNFDFDMEFLAPGTNATVGRHGGAMFFASVPTHRGDPAMNGYFLDWIDRASDRGVRFTRVNGGVQTLLVAGQGAGAPPEPPRHYRVEVEGADIRVFGDDVLYVDVTDNTHRGGHVGFWVWSGGEHAAYDNLCVTEPAGIVAPCFEITAGRRIAHSTLTFDASCSVVSSGEITAYEWDFGDGTTASGVVLEHTYATGGTYTVTLTIEDSAGSRASTDQEVFVADVVIDAVEDFNRPDGAVSGWTVAQGLSWALSGGELAAGPTTQEHWIWYGDPPQYAPSDVSFEFDHAFLAPGTVPAVGRHGGFQFHCDRPTVRSGGTAFSGYFVDWIDRPSDRGVRLTRVDRGAFVGLVAGQGAGAPPDPPQMWRVVVDGDRIQVFGDGVQYIDVVDSTYRGGFFGFWTWEGGQQVAIDDLTIDGDPLAPCMSVSPERPLAGEPLTFDGSCSEVFGGGSAIVSYDWELGDGAMASGVTVEHTYAAPDVYTVTLTVTDDLGASKSLAKTVTVSENLVPFTDCFDRDPGPPGGWTPALGDWAITDTGRLETSTTTGAPDAESWIYAGDPAAVGRGDMTISFEVPSVLFTGNPADPVGRHFGVIFFANTLTTNRFAADSSGYTFWWIDRASDFGLNLARWDGPSLVLLHVGTFGLVADPPAVWRIEVQGARIRLFGDGVLYIDVEDDTYREGYFGFWVWKNMSIQFDSVRIWSDEEPPFCAATGHLAGDCNADGGRSIADVVCYVRHLFHGFFLLDRTVPPAPCGGGLGAPANLAILDLNGDGRIDLTEAIYLARFLFSGGPPPVQGLECFDQDAALGCTESPGCP